MNPEELAMKKLFLNLWEPIFNSYKLYQEWMETTSEKEMAFTYETLVRYANEINKVENIDSLFLETPTYAEYLDSVPPEYR